MTRFLTLFFCLIAAAATADPLQYQLDTARSAVTFTFGFDGKPRKGEMPVKSADLLLDLDNIPASKVAVTLNARGARAGFIFFTDAMKSDDVLSTRRFPEITFRSTRIRGDLKGATVTGDLTMRGVTRPVTLKAQLFRQRGTEVNDRNNLLILLTGTVSRRAFGANGYPKLVGDAIGLRIIARVTR